MTAARPEIDCEQYHATMYLRDVLASVDFYTTGLGSHLDFTWGGPTSMAGVSSYRFVEE